MIVVAMIANLAAPTFAMQDNYQVFKIPTIDIEVLLPRCGFIVEHYQLLSGIYLWGGNKDDVCCHFDCQNLSLT
jgi:hypothetical protein